MKRQRTRRVTATRYPLLSWSFTMTRTFTLISALRSR
jgi:hypothetical protein